MTNRPYREFVGALAWLTPRTRPDIAFATSSLACLGHNPGRAHWDVAKRVVRYLKGTNQWRLTLGGKSPQIAVFTDADWGSHHDDRRSIGAYTIKIRDGVVSLKSKKQPCVAFSSTKAEYMALSQELVWNMTLRQVKGSLYAAVIVTLSMPGSAKVRTRRRWLMRIEMRVA